MERRGFSGAGRSAALCGALVFVICAVVGASAPRGVAWVVDEGGKALVAQRLVESRGTRLDLVHPGARFDPGGEAFPIPPPYALRRADRFYSQYPPAFPALAAPLLALFGDFGLRLPAAFGTALCAALLVLACAPRCGRRAAFGFGFFAGLATPLGFFGLVVWEHSLTAALALAASLCARSERTPALVLAGALLGAALWLRAELVLFAFALLVALAAQRRLRAALVVGAPLALAGLAWLAFNHAVYGAALGPHVGGNVGLEFAAAPRALARRAAELLVWRDPAALQAPALLGLLLALGGGHAAMRHGWGALCVASLCALGALLQMAAALEVARADAPFLALPAHNGLLLRFPLFVLAGAGLARLGRAPGLQLPIESGLGFLALLIPLRLVATDFFTGGSWSDRMLLPGLPALLLLALLAIEGAWRESDSSADASRAVHGSGSGRSLRCALVAVLVLLAAAGLTASAIAARVLLDQRREAQRLAEFIDAQREPALVTDHPALAQQLFSRWSAQPLLLVDGSKVARVLEVARRRGLGDFLLLRRHLRRTLPNEVPGADCTRLPDYAGRSAPLVLDLEVWRCRSRAPG